MSIEYFIELYEKGQLTEEVMEQMQHFAFDANDDEVFIIAQILPRWHMYQRLLN